MFENIKKAVSSTIRFFFWSLLLIVVLYGIAVWRGCGDVVKTPEKIVLEKRDTSNSLSYSKQVAQQVLDAIKDGYYIKVQTKEKIQFEAIAKQGWFDMEGKRAYCSRDLLYTIDALVQYTHKTDTKFAFLSLIRLGSDNHGMIQADGSVLCRAVDINIFDNQEVRFKVPTEADKRIALNCMLALIAALPAGRYSIGTPRPVGGKNIDPSNDFFLPVTDLAQNGRSQDFENMVSQMAKDELREALKANPLAEISNWYPDAADHIHLKVFDKTDKK